MPGKGSAQKRHRQSVKRRLRNRIAKSEVKTSIKGFLENIEAQDKEKAELSFREVTKLIDTATRKGTFHKNTAARKKSRLHHMLNSIGS